jgi:Holliday junction resolvasome RuvABC endonuclease subunit
MRVFGIDPSLAATGVATAHDQVHVVKTKGSKGATTQERHDRLTEIRRRVLQLLAQAGSAPGDLVVIEGPPFTGDPYIWDRAGLWWLMQNDLRGLGYVVVDVHPSHLKKYATGSGSANKGRMADAAARRIPDVHTHGEDNAVDALWLRAMGLDQLGQPLAALPAEQRAVLDRVAWPDLAGATRG